MLSLYLFFHAYDMLAYVRVYIEWCSLQTDYYGNKYNGVYWGSIEPFYERFGHYNYKLGGSAQQTETAMLSLNVSKSLKLPNKEKMNRWSSGGYINACYL